jgi:alpha-tubulin suppressor-like RCC1 family protein
LALAIASVSAALILMMAGRANATVPNVAKAWGRNTSGQLGDETFTGPEVCGSVEKIACSTNPVSVSELSGVTALAGGNANSLALLQGGAAMAWGDNTYGQLGNGETGGGQGAPVAVKELGGAIALAAGGAGHSLALLSNGTVVAWGRNTRGQLGNGTTSNTDVPVPVCTLGATAPCSEASQQLKGVIAIAAGYEDSLALLSNGTVVAWGDNEVGELGTGATTDTAVPVPVCAPGETFPCAKDLEGVAAIAAGQEHSLALLSNGKVMAWGLNSAGELGNGSEANSSVPVAVSALTGVTAVSAGENFSLAVLAGGGVMTWGRNKVGQLGDGLSTGPELCGALGACAKVPVSVCAGGMPGPCPTGPYLSGVTAAASSGEHVVVLVRGGLVKSWGENQYGQLGDGTSTGPERCGTFAQACSATPVEVNDVSGATGVGSGGKHSLAFGAPPAVTEVKPKKGAATGGTTVTITGEGFTGATAVKFGSADAPSFVVNSASSITAVTPAETPARVNVTVANGFGTSAISTGDRFTFTPTVIGVTPSSGPSAGGTTVTVDGSGFLTGTRGTRFRFAKMLAPSVGCASTTECTVVVPPHDVGTVDVKAIVNRIASPRNRPGDEFRYT